MGLTEAKILAHVASIRAGASIFLIDTAQLLRRAGITYPNGEARPVYSDPIDFNCRLITRSGSESKNIAAQAREITQVSFTELYRMQIPYELEVSLGDVILYTDIVTGDIKRFEIVHAPAKNIYTAACIIFLQEQH